MVTASHNPAKYNGLKICKDGAFPVGDETGLPEIEALVLGTTFPTPARKGTVSTQELLDAYIRHNLTFLRTEQPFRIVVDAGNGMGGYVYDRLRALAPPSIHIIPMYFTPDGTFPNHEANPLKEETCKELQERVVLENADLGVSLDGDGDRVFFIDNQGRYLNSDITLALVARQLLGEKGPGIIHYGINQGHMVTEEIAKYGGTPQVCRVGHARYKALMRSTKAYFGGEHSGHFFHAEEQNCENTMIVLFRLLSLLSSTQQSLADLVTPLMRYSKLPETNFEVEDAKAALARVTERLQPSAKEIITIDGVRFEMGDWWVCVRSSNTEPVLRLNMEFNNHLLQERMFPMLCEIIGGTLKK
jgi:phosphomannomutase